MANGFALAFREANGQSDYNLSMNRGGDELANLTRFLFADLVTQRGIPRHYGPEELTEDLAYANGE
jgi:predicted HTH domain antitoxin